MVWLDDLHDSVIQWFYVMCWEDGILVSQIMCFLPLDPCASSEPQGHSCLLLPLLQQPTTAAILHLLGWVLCRLHEWKMYFALHPLAFLLTWGAYTGLCAWESFCDTPYQGTLRTGRQAPVMAETGSTRESEICLSLRMARSWESFSVTFPFPQEILWFAILSGPHLGHFALTSGERTDLLSWSPLHHSNATLRKPSGLTPLVWLKAWGLL